MNIVGFITEYNPFHNGHAYHLEEAKRVTGADASVAVMSGDFVQRGFPAITDKYARTKMALEAGVDAVVELPVAAATASAETFAYNAVKILTELGADSIVYGAEDAEQHSEIKQIAMLFAHESEEFQTALREALKSGQSYAAARAEAAERVLPSAADILAKPNNILAIEYEKAIIRLGSSVKTYAITRNDAGYHESGTAIRDAIGQAGAASNFGMTLEKLVPRTTIENLNYCLTLDDFSQLLFYKLSQLSERDLTAYADVTEEIAARIMRYAKIAESFDEITEMVSAKNIAMTTSRRALLHILLDIKKDDECPHVARVLGFRGDSRVMKELKSRAQIPLVTKLADLDSVGCGDGSWIIDEKASKVYNQVVKMRHGIIVPDEYHAGVIIT